jgi:hypothetical protein
MPWCESIRAFPISTYGANRSQQSFYFITEQLTRVDCLESAQLVNHVAQKQDCVSALTTVQSQIHLQM